MSQSEILDIEKIRSLLQTDMLGREPLAVLEVWDSIDSTNKRALDLARDGAAEGSCVLAREQTAGRGRLGRNWVSPPDSGIYLSIILRPDLAMEDLPLITLATGVACSRAILGECGAIAGLKWVNDLIYDRKKLGGILVEMQKPAVVVGIGINVRHDENSVPDELKEKMTWLGRFVDTEFSTNSLVAEILSQMEEYYSILSLDGKDQILDEWRNLSVNIGQHVSCQSGNQNIEGEVVDINEQGALLVRNADGVHTVYAGEVTIRNLDGSYT